jgi:hypothetical protein
VIVAPHLGGGASGGGSSTAGATAGAAGAASVESQSAGGATAGGAPQARSVADESAPAPAAVPGLAAPASTSAFRAQTATVPRSAVGRRVQQAAEDAYRAAQLAIERSGAPAP